MASTGAKLPTSSSSTAETPWDDASWTSTTYIYATDGDAAFGGLTSGQKSEVLRAGGFDLSSIPDGAQIDGVEVVVRAALAGTDASIDLVQLLDASGARVGTNKASTPTTLTVSYADYTFGGASDLWSNSLDAAWVKDADFGVAVGAVSSAGGNALIDSVTVNVYYTVVPRTYYVVYLDSATDPADNSTGYGQIIAGQDGSGAAAVASGSIVAPTADATDSALATITGLSASTTYRAAAVWWDAASDYGAGRILSAGITTSAGGGGYTHPTLSAATLVPAGGNNYQPRVTYTF